MVTLKEMQMAIEEGVIKSTTDATQRFPRSISVKIDFFPFKSLDSVPTAYNFARRLSRAAKKPSTQWRVPRGGA